MTTTDIILGAIYWYVWRPLKWVLAFTVWLLAIYGIYRLTRNG